MHRKMMQLKRMMTPLKKIISTTEQTGEPKNDTEKNLEELPETCF